MTTKQFETRLRDLLQTGPDDDNEECNIRRVETYREAGILSNDRGLVVTFDNGSEIQVTLVQSRRGRDGEDGDD